MQRYAGEQQLKPLLAGLPTSVEVTRRVKGAREYYFLLNHGEAPAAVNPGAGFVDLLTGAPAPNFTLDAFDYRVLTRERSPSASRDAAYAVP
jgi:beta-galactosidase GanA